MPPKGKGKENVIPSEPPSFKRKLKGISGPSLDDEYVRARSIGIGTARSTWRSFPLQVCMLSKLVLLHFLVIHGDWIPDR
jgi:hypothetical protein